MTAGSRSGLVVLVVACAVLAVVVAGWPAPAPVRPSATVRAAVDDSTPDFVGLSRTGVLCALRGDDRTLVLDGRVETRSARRASDGLCTGATQVQPDPPVRRQSPAAGEPLADDATIRVWTPCFRRRCL